MTTCPLAFGLAARGENLTLSEYATRLESSVAVMNARIDALDVQMENATSADEVQRLWDERVAARQQLVQDFEAFDPLGTPLSSTR